MLYEAKLATWMRVLSVVLAAFLLAMVGGPLAMVLVHGGPLWVPLILGPLLLCVLLIIVFGNRQSFTVTSEGVLVKSWFTTVEVPWAEVAAIEVDRRVMTRGATVIVTRDGRRIVSALTAARFALRRGEATADHGPDLLHPAIPTRAAIDGHQRWWRGEFAAPAR